MAKIHPDILNFSINTFVMYHSGAEKTRDELRIQVYDAMAEKEKTVVTAQELKSEDPNNTAEVKKENGVLTSPVTNVTGSEEPSKSSVHLEKSSVQEAIVNAVEKNPNSSVNGAGESPAGSHGIKTVNEKVEDSEERNGNVATAKFKGGQDEELRSEAAQDEEEPEGSKY